MAHVHMSECASEAPLAPCGFRLRFEVHMSALECAHVRSNVRALHSKCSKRASFVVVVVVGQASGRARLATGSAWPSASDKCKLAREGVSASAHLIHGALAYVERGGVSARAARACTCMRAAGACFRMVF